MEPEVVPGGSRLTKRIRPHTVSVVRRSAHPRRSSCPSAPLGVDSFRAPIFWKAAWASVGRANSTNP